MRLELLLIIRFPWRTVW